MGNRNYQTNRPLSGPKLCRNPNASRTQIEEFTLAAWTEARTWEQEIAIRAVFILAPPSFSAYQATKYHHE
jgi:hypothetical protein